MITIKYKIPPIILSLHLLVIIIFLNFSNKFSLIGNWHFKGDVEKFNELFQIQEISLKSYLLSTFKNGKFFLTFEDQNKCKIEFIHAMKKDNYLLECEYTYNSSTSPNTISFNNIENVDGGRHGILIFSEKNLFKISSLSLKKKFRPLFIKNQNTFIRKINKQ